MMSYGRELHTKQRCLIAFARVTVCVCGGKGGGGAPLSGEEGGGGLHLPQMPTCNDWKGGGGGGSGGYGSPPSLELEYEYN